MRRVLLGLALVLGLVLVQPSPATAACAGEGSVTAAAAAPGALVFVGTAVEVDNVNTWATFAVEEVWAGDVDGRTEVEIHGAPPLDEFITVGEARAFALGARYLVVPASQNIWEDFGDREGVLSDNACTSTQTWNDGLARYRPANATIVERDEPIQPRTNEDSSPPYVMIALTTILVAGGCLYLLFRRGSIAYRARQDEERSSQA
jgi:hypothetical protein